MALPCAVWPGSWDLRSRTRRWVSSVWRPLQGGRGHGGNLGPSLEHPERLQPVCPPGAAAGAWRAACPSTGRAAAGRWGLKSWGPPLRSHEAVKTTALTLLSPSAWKGSRGEGGGGGGRSGRSCSGLNDTPRTSAPFSQRPTGAATRVPWEERGGGAHTSVVPQGLFPVSSFRALPCHIFFMFKLLTFI